MATPQISTWAAPQTIRPRLFRNALFLVAAQALVIPISVLVNAVAARTLGPVDYGRLFLAMTYATFAFLFVEWGQANFLTAKVATSRGRAGELLGSGLLWRMGTALSVGLVLPVLCRFLNYDRAFIVVLEMTLLNATLMTVAGACQDVFRGYERTDFAAASFVGWQLLSAAVAIPTLLLGGGIFGLLIAQALCAAVGAGFVLMMLPRMQVPKLTAHVATLGELFRGGRAFLAFGIVLALQPMIDSAMLSKFASADAMGWYAAARKLTGILIYPATALGVAAYPTLCRLHAQDQAAFRKTVADMLHIVTLLGVPVALGCALFPQLGIMIFSERSYGPSEDDLRVLAVYVLLVYFSMTLSTCLTSSGRQVVWTGVQFVCVIVSIVCDPPLILWLQARTGNGSLGVCVTGVVSEMLMLGAGLFLLPPGILDKGLLSKLGAALLAAAVMAAVAWLLSRIDVFARALLAVVAYVVCLWLTGALGANQLRTFLTYARQRL